MLARLKAMRRKHGLGEFKKTKMARKIRAGVSYMAKKHRSVSRSSGGGMMKNVAAGVGAAQLIKQFGGPSLGSLGPIASLAGAYYVGGMPGVLGAFVAGNGLGNTLGGAGAATSGTASW